MKTTLLHKLKLRERTKAQLDEEWRTRVIYHSFAVLTPKLFKVYKLRRLGWSYTDIAKEINSKPQWTSNLYHKAVRLLTTPPDWKDELGFRVCNILDQLEITSRAEAVEAIVQKRLWPGKVRNYGRISHARLCKALNIYNKI